MERDPLALRAQGEFAGGADKGLLLTCKWTMFDTDSPRIEKNSIMAPRFNRGAAI